MIMWNSGLLSRYLSAWIVAVMVSVGQVHAASSASVSLQASGGAASVELSWSVDGTLRNIQLYRDTDSNPSGRSRIAILGGSARQYTDTSVSSGQAYWYWVKYIDTDNQVGNSNASSATPGLGTNLDTGGHCTSDPLSGGYYSLVNQGSGKALDIAYAATDNGGNLIQWPYGAARNQQFQLADLGNGYWSLSAVHSGLALDVSGWSGEEGGNVQQWQYHGGSNQQWALQRSTTGLFTILSRHSGKALSVADGQAGSNVYQQSDRASAYQRWYLDPVDGRCGDQDTGTANRAPVARSAGDQEVSSGQAVTLDGSASYDPDGDALNYTWVQTQGDEIMLGDSTSPTLSFVAPDVDQTTEYTFQLSIDDGELSSQVSVKLRVTQSVVDNNTGVTSLKSLADFPVGVAVNAGNEANSIINSATSARQQAVVFPHFDQMTAGNIMKMSYLHPSEYSFNFTQADALAAFADAHGLDLHGHTLIWHSDYQVPGFMKNYTGDFAAMLKRHVQTIVSHYSGKVVSWDVVNEALADNGESGAVNGFRNSIFYQKMGLDYIDRAFIDAREADPFADLYYNDYSIENGGAKTENLLALIDGLKARGVPITGVGFQMHVLASWPSTSTLESAMKAVADRGLKVKISELDVRVNNPYDASAPVYRSLTSEAAAIQKERYHQIVAAYRRAVPPGLRGGITVWGVWDADSWLNTPEQPDWPLLFDENFQTKPALQGFADGLL